MLKNKQEVLNAVLPRIVQPSSTDDAKMALEIVAGPYKGVVYGYTSFQAVGEVKDSMQPVKYETCIYSAPDEFKHDEAFDVFTTEVLIAWLELVSELENKTHIEGQ